MIKIFEWSKINNIYVYVYVTITVNIINAMLKIITKLKDKDINYI